MMKARLLPWAGRLVAVLLALLVFAAYGNPDLSRTLADLVWACL